MILSLFRFVRHKFTVSLITVCVAPIVLLSQTAPSAIADDFFLDLGIVIEPSTGNEEVNRLIQSPPEKVKLFINKAPSGSVYMASTKELQEALTRISYKIESLQLAFQRQTSYLKEENRELRGMITDLMEQVESPVDALAAVNEIEKPLSDNVEEATDHTPNTESSESPLTNKPSTEKLSGEVLPAKTEEVSPPEFNRMLYMNAVFAYQREDYKTAIRKFSDLAVEAVDDITAGNVIYWIADCYFQLGQPSEALSVLMQLEVFKESDKQDDSKILQGLAFRQLGQEEKAAAAFSEVVEQYPESEYYRLAQMEFNRSVK